MQGWIKLHRKIWEWPHAKDPEYLSVWLYLITNATHKSYDAIFNGQRITLKKGQLITGRLSISRETSVSDSKVQRILKKLEIEQQIEQQTGNKNRLISILNWEVYQCDEQQSEQQVNNKRTTTEQQLNTNKNVNNKNNVKNEKKNNPLTPQVKDDFHLPEGIDPQTWKDFEDMRNKIKAPLTPRAKILMIDKLKKINTETNQDPNDLLNHSIMNCWKSVFPIKDHNPKGNNYGNQSNNQKPSLQDIIRDQAAEFAKDLER